MLISPIFCKSNKVNLRTQRTKLAIILCLGPVPQIKSCHFLRHESLWFFSYFLFLLSLFVLSLGLQFHRSSLVVSAFTFTFFESSQLELLYAGDLTVSENWVLFLVGMESIDTTKPKIRRRKDLLLATGCLLLKRCTQ